MKKKIFKIVISVMLVIVMISTMILPAFADYIQISNRNVEYELEFEGVVFHVSKSFDRSGGKTVTVTSNGQSSTSYNDGNNIVITSSDRETVTIAANAHVEENSAVWDSDAELELQPMMATNSSCPPTNPNLLTNVNAVGLSGNRWYGYTQFNSTYRLYNGFYKNNVPFNQNSNAFAGNVHSMRSAYMSLGSYGFAIFFAASLIDTLLGFFITNAFIAYVIQFVVSHIITNVIFPTYTAWNNAEKNARSNFAKC